MNCRLAAVPSVRQGDGQLKEGCMRIEVKGRNVVVGDELRERIVKRCEKMARQVSPLAVMDVELSEERNPSIKDGHIAECTLRLKGVTLRSRSVRGSRVRPVGDGVPRSVATRRSASGSDHPRSSRRKASPVSALSSERGCACPFELDRI